MVPAYPPLEAYRRDVARLAPTQTFGLDDGEWLAASLMLQQYVDAAPDDRQRLGRELAIYLAAGEETTVCDAALRLAVSIERAGALHLAASWLALLERVVSTDRVLDRGRVLARRGSLARKFGDPDGARAVYEQVEAMAERHAEPELTARAWIGYGILAQMRGNYPEARRWYTGAALIADDNGCADPAYAAHIGLLSCAAIARDGNEGMREGWRAYRLANGDPGREAEVLTNLAQLLYDRGEYAVALHGFAAAVARAKYPDVLFPALGGVARSAARLRLSSIVDAAARHVESDAVVAWPYPLCAALIELSDANLLLGRDDVAADYRSRAAAIATARGFHELSHRAAHPAPAPAPVVADPLDAEAQRIVRDLGRIDAPAELRAPV